MDDGKREWDIWQECCGSRVPWDALALAHRLSWAQYLSLRYRGITPGQKLREAMIAAGFTISCKGSMEESLAKVANELGITASGGG